MSRRICMDLHDEIAKLHPAWVREDDEVAELSLPLDVA